MGLFGRKEELNVSQFEETISSFVEEKIEGLSSASIDRTEQELQGRDMNDFSEVTEVFATVGFSEMNVRAWLTNKTMLLGGATPLEKWDAGNHELVLRAADEVVKVERNAWSGTVRPIPENPGDSESADDNDEPGVEEA